MGGQLLLLLAILPGALLLKIIYDKDAIEKEPRGLIVKLLICGAISTVPAVILELVGCGLLELFLSTDSLVYMLLENFLVVACAEEIMKYLFLKGITWKNREFNFCFDGVVYAVAVSLGFAILENVEYAFSYGIVTTLIRAITAVPAHTVFGVFMGSYYGIAKGYDNYGRTRERDQLLRRALLVPILLHGFYDFVASGQNALSSLVFLGFVIIVDVIAIKRVKNFSKHDSRIA